MRKFKAFLLFANRGLRLTDFFLLSIPFFYIFCSIFIKNHPFQINTIFPQALFFKHSKHLSTLNEVDQLFPHIVFIVSCPWTQCLCSALLPDTGLRYSPDAVMSARRKRIIWELISIIENQYYKDVPFLSHTKSHERWWCPGLPVRIPNICMHDHSCRSKECSKLAHFASLCTCRYGTIYCQATTAPITPKQPTALWGIQVHTL